MTMRLPLRLFPMLALLLFVTPQARAVLGICDVRRYGAKGDGVTDDTAAIQKAIDACANSIKSPGAVSLDRGVFLSGPLVVNGSNEWLTIGKDAVLRASSKRGERWWDAERKRVRPFILVSGGDLLVEGYGRIESRSQEWERVNVKAIGIGIWSPYAERPYGLAVRNGGNVVIEALHVD